MNPFLIILILFFAIVLWFLMSFAFIPLGLLVKKIFKDTLEIIKESREDKNE